MSPVNVRPWGHSGVPLALLPLMSCWLMILALAAIPVSAAAAENLALGASYAFSRPPLYELTRDEGDASQLTDGRLAEGMLTAGTMWMSKWGVGWLTDAHPISIEIDLGREQPVGKVCLRSARGTEAGVSFPRRVDVLVSGDQAHYIWTGRLSPLADAGEGSYLAREFCSHDIGRSGRYVRLEVAAQGSYFFTDEIVVKETQRAAGKDSGSGAATARTSAAPLAAGDIKSFVLKHEALSQTVAALIQRYRGYDRAEVARERLDRVALTLDGGKADLDLAALSMLDQMIRRIVRDVRLARGGGVEVRQADPWALATPMDGAVLNNDPGPLDIPAGGHGLLAVAIEHVEPEAVYFSISATVAGAGANNGLTVTPYEVALVTRADGVRMGDPLVPLRDGRLRVAMGETRQMCLDIHARPGAKVESAVVTLHVEAELAGGHLTRSIAFPVAIHAVPLPEAPPSTVAWGYLNALPIRDKPSAAVADMLDHGLNTAVLPAAHVPWPKEGAKPEDVLIGDYRLFDEVMKSLEGHRQYLFFLGFNSDSSNRTFGRRHEFLSESWKALFSAWVKEWSTRMNAAGIGYDAFALYPVDEPHAGEERDNLVAVARLIKQANPNIRVYTTLHVPEALSESLIEVVDIFQLNWVIVTPAVLSRLKNRGRQVWLYAAMGGGKGGDPASYYRAQAWEAFNLGLSGFGFWAYADTGLSGSAWDDTDDVRPDFAVIYDSSSGIVSSKRWEAWREGVQDFALLNAAQRAARDPASRHRVEELARQGGTHIADPKGLAETRRRLFEIVRSASPVGIAP